MSEWTWIEKSLGEVTTKIADRDHFTPIYVELGVAIISPKDITLDEKIDFSDCKFITREAHELNRKKTDLKPGDLVFTRIGALLGKVCIVESWMPQFSILHSAAMIRADESIIQSEYLMYFIKSHQFQSQIKNEIQSIGVPDLGLEKIKRFKIVYPTNKKVQRRIAQILSTVDGVIGKTRAAIAKYKAIKQGMLHDLFTRGIDVNTGRLRPKYEDAPELYKESKLGWVPREWEVERLEDLCSEKPTYGINAAAVDFTHQLPTYIRITDIDEEGNFSKTGRKCVDSPFSGQYILKKGDLVFARTGATVGKTYLYNEEDGILVFAGFLIKVSPNEELLDYNFLKFLTETSYYLNWVVLMSQRSGHPGFNGNEYGNLQVPKPSVIEQRIISENLLSKRNKIQTEQSYLEKMERVKAGLMGDLLSGRVQVSESEFSGL